MLIVLNESKLIDRGAMNSSSWPFLSAFSMSGRARGARLTPASGVKLLC